MTENEGVRVAQLLVANLASAQLLRMEVLDRDVIDRDEIIRLADILEKHTYEIAHLALGANIDEWKAEQERKQKRE